MLYDCGMFLFLLAMVTGSLANTSHAQTTLPLFETPENAGPELSSIKRFRVLVFPHFGAYSTPQGREASDATVKIISTETCDAYSANLDSNQEWQKSGEVLESVSSISLKASKTNEAIYYECKAPFTVQRIAPLKSYVYAGDFVAVKNSTGVQIVNLIDAEDYIKGVVPSEVLFSWPMETLKAQAVAARTYAWWSVVNARKKVADYDMDDTVKYQAYLGTGVRNEATDTATDQTSRQVLKHQGEIIKAYFSADSGGFTESAKATFDEDLGYCQAKAELYDVTQTKTAWTKAFDAATLKSKLVGAGLIPSAVVIKQASVDAKSRNSSGRVDQLSVLGTNGKTYLVNGAKFRYATGIRSTFFEVKNEGGQITLTGKGYGHGVGMAQIGALEYVRQLNWTYDQVLKFYYTDTVLTAE